MRRKVCVTLVDRANYGRLKPVLAAIQSHPDLELQVVVGGTMVLNRFKRPEQVVEADGFRVGGRVFHEVEGNTGGTMARGIGLGVLAYTAEYERLAPDVVLIIGDRYEALAAAQAAVYSGRCLLHFQGGEVSGTLDEFARHAITKLAHFHVPATEQAKRNILAMGEREDSILAVGCPSSDAARAYWMQDGFVNIERQILAVYHPNTCHAESAAEEMSHFLNALLLAMHPVTLLWPNIDAGSDAVSKEIRRFRDGNEDWLTVETNLEPEAYLLLLAQVQCCVGNSSSFVRDAGFFGTPVVLVGDRQDGRECGENVLRCGAFEKSILSAIQSQLKKVRYAPSQLYGDGHVAERVANRLASVELYKQKRLAYGARSSHNVQPVSVG